MRLSRKAKVKVEVKAKITMKDDPFSSPPSVSTLASSLPGVLLQPLARASDHRGWLVELFRADVLEKAGLKDAQPVMAYLSMTRPGVVRGPHEHHEQTDFFAFVGPSDFEVALWDNRPGSPTRGRREVFVLGVGRPATLIVPPGVVHAYRNVGKVEGWVLNFPNRLYKGPGQLEPVDEIRHEDDPNSSFKSQVPGPTSPNHGL
jgi:dTDP-4-dehydrorhamnose 3,5-epimerase